MGEASDHGNAVRSVLLERLASGSQPGRRDDAHVVALCVEGGAMRGVVSSGMMVALEHVGLLPAFDRVYGSSAGAVNAAFFLAGQSALGTSIYYQDINNGHFINRWNFFRGRPIVDIDYLMEHVVVERKRLDTQQVIDSDIPLNVLATNAESAEGVVFRSFEGDRDVRHALRAGASIPILSGPPFAYRDAAYYDGAIAAPVPVRPAVEDGCTHVLALLTRPPGERFPRKLGVLERNLVAKRLLRNYPALGQAYARRHEAYDDATALIDGHATSDSGTRFLGVRPKPPMPDPLAKRTSELMESARRGSRAVLNALGLDEVES